MAVLLSPVGGVAAQFFDNNGNPLSGGKLFSYAAGTTTPAATYTSSLGTTAHTNPIVLDSGGRVPGGEIWLTDGVIYKFVLQTSTNVLIATYDNIVGINSNFVNYTTEQEIQTATAGQTVFNLATTQYQPGTNSLTVYVDGVNQYGPGAQYAYLETDSTTVTFVSGLHVGASVKFTTATQTTGNATDASVVAYTPPFTGSVATNVETKLAQTVSITDFGGAAGANDNTAAMNAAADALNAIGGGIILIPYAGEWRMNWVCLYNNITVQGVGGSGEYNVNCIRPFVITSAPITFGDGNTIVRYCGLENVHISGIAVAGGAAAGVTQVAFNADHALLLRGGTVNFTANRVVVYNGRRSVSLEPSLTQPVTNTRFNNGTIRNDLTDASGARCIYLEYVSVAGYATDNKFVETKVNGPTLGYAAVAVNCLLEVTDSYWDVKPDHGILLSGAAGLVCHNLQLDPGTNNVVVIGWDNAQTNPARFIRGILRHGGQKWANSTGSGDLPNESDTYGYKSLFKDTWLSNATYFTNDISATDTDVYVEPGGAGGARYLALSGADFIPQITNVKSIGSTSFRWAESWATKVYAGDSDCFWTSGAGSPEGVVTAPVGSLYTNRSGSTSTTLYVKTSGSGNTGWTAK